MKVALIACLTVALLLPSAFAQQGDAEHARIAQLVARLEASDWRAREKAQRELVAIGQSVAPFLESLSSHPVFEVRARAQQILQQIRFVSPEEAAKIEEALKKYDPGDKGDAMRRLVLQLRRNTNAPFYLIEKMLNAAPGERDKIASLLAAIEYRIEGRRIDPGISHATDILLSLVRDESVKTGLRLRAFSALRGLADKDSAACLSDFLEQATGKLLRHTLNALCAIAGEKKRDESLDSLKSKMSLWWSKACKEPQYEKALQHLARRKDFEAKDALRNIPMLGVTKDPYYPAGRGARVQSTAAGGGAAKGGVLAGDVIVEFDGRPVKSWSDLVRGIHRSYVGQKVLLKLLRGGKEVEIDAVLGKRN